MKMQANRQQTGSKKYVYAYSILFFISGISIVIGIVNVLVPNIMKLGAYSIVSIIGGIIFGILGYFVRQERSHTALWIAIILYSMDTLTYLIAIFQGSALALSGLVVHIIFLVGISRGFAGLDELETQSHY